MTETMKDIAVIGDRQLCLGFRLAGIQETYPVSTEEFEAQFDELMNQDLGIVITHNEYLNELNRKKRMRIQNSVDPVVVALSEEGESQDLRAKIKKAIGVDIWQ